jgi:hypothetical protein
MAHQSTPLSRRGQEVSLLQSYFAAHPCPDRGWQEKFANIVRTSLLGVVPLAFPSARPEELRALWGYVRHVIKCSVSDNLAYSLITDAAQDEVISWEMWAPYLADLFEHEDVVLNAGSFAVAIRAADDLFKTWDGQGFMLALERMDERQQGVAEMTSLAVIAIAGAAAVAAGVLLGQQLLLPSAEFIAIRKLAIRHRWARELLRRGPRLAERTEWTLKKAWSPDLFHSTGERDAACRLIAEVGASFSLIVPSLGNVFANEEMEAVDEISCGWVRDVVEAGLRSGEEVIHRAVVRLTTADEIALQKTQHRLSTFYMTQSPCVAVLRTKGFVTDCLKATEDVARSRDEVDEWIRAITRNSPSSELQLLLPKIGERINENEMVLFEEVLLPAKAVVTRVLRPGLKKRGVCLCKAEVVASNN